MQRFLIDVELSFELDNGNGFERGSGGVDRLNLNVEESMCGAGIGESLLASFGVTCRVLLPVADVTGSGGFGMVLEANPDGSAGGGDSTA